VENGIDRISEYEDYTSHNTIRLNLEETKNMLLNLSFIQESLKGVFNPIL